MSESVSGAASRDAGISVSKLRGRVRIPWAKPGLSVRVRFPLCGPGVVVREPSARRLGGWQRQAQMRMRATIQHVAVSADVTTRQTAIETARPRRMAMPIRSVSRVPRDERRMRQPPAAFRLPAKTARQMRHPAAAEDVLVIVVRRRRGRRSSLAYPRIGADWIGIGGWPAVAGGMAWWSRSGVGWARPGWALLPA